MKPPISQRIETAVRQVTAEGTSQRACSASPIARSRIASAMSSKPYFAPRAEALSRGRKHEDKGSEHHQTFMDAHVSPKSGGVRRHVKARPRQ